MKRLIVLLFAFLLSITLLSAQEFNAEQAEHYLQTTLTQHGEESSEYLATLDLLCIVAEQYNHTDIAIKYRQKHIEVIERTKGADSNEWAEDYTKFGELLFSLDKLELALPLFLQSLCVYENNSCPYNNYYQLCVGRISDCYRKLEQYDQALIYQEKYLNIARELFGDIDYIYLWANVIAAHLAGMVDQWDKVELYSRNVLDVISINEDNFYIYENAQLCMHTYLWRNEQYQEATDLAIEFSENTKKFKGEISLEYAKSLSQIAGNYFVMDKVDSCVQYSLDAIKIYESYFAGDKDSLYKQEGYLNECNRLANVYSLVGRDFESFNYLKIICDVLKYNNKTETEEYYTSIQSLFMASAELGDYQFTLSIADSYYDMINKFSKNANEDLLVFYSNMSNIHINSNPQQAIYYMEKMIDILPLLCSGEKLNYELFDLYIAISSSSNEVQQQQMYFNKAQELANSLRKDSYESEMANAAILHIKGKRESSDKDAIELYTQALTCLIESQNKLLEQLDILYSEKQYAGWRDEEIVLLQSRVRSIDDFAKTIIANRGLSYNSIGCYDSALNDFAAACTIADKTRTNNSYDYISLQNNLASCEMNTGRYSAAVARLDNAMKDAAYQYGENSFIYACCLLNYSRYHYFVGQYNEGVEKACKALDIYMDIELSLLDENYISAQLAISDFCVVLNLYDSALNWANMAYNNLAQLESTTTLFPKCLIQMGKIYMKQNKIKEGTEAFLNAKQILDTECDEKSKYNVLAHWENEFGTSLWELGYLKSACIHLNNVLYYLFNTENYGSPIATHALYKMGVSHIVDNTHPNDDYFHNALSCLQHYFVRNIAFITELDRILLWNQIERYKDIFFTLYANGSSSTYLFDYLLFSKSILLKTSIDFGKSILNSSDEELIGKYHQLLAMKDAENRRVQLGRIDMAPSQDIPRLEREILSQVAGLEDYLADLNCTYVDIANALGDNEVAIEFVDYINLKTDKKHYVALVMRKGWETPKYIDLFEGEDLDALLEYSPQALYSKGTIGTQLYDLVWAPLASEIKDGDTIYFSPSGELYTLGIEAILSPQGEPLNQLYNMYRLTSTREIFNLSDNAKISYAALYGGLKYDVTPEQMAQMSSTAHKNYDVKSVDFDGGSQERAGWSYLPGTEREVEYISELMQSQNIAHSKYIGEFGNEESFKMLSGKGCNVLHLATHGFFVDKQDVSKKKYLESMINDSKESQIIDPMYRSGLLFAGSNNRWTGLELESGVEDGIMTAAEIATMDLTETDIVVLSACDTGLGDVSGDGVFGLQRAFKQAGVQTIVMSLWRVDDAATELMMTTFYNNLLSGKSKRDSFIIAQNTLRNHEQFSNPYYWAAFVMLD